LQVKRHALLLGQGRVGRNKKNNAKKVMGLDYFAPVDFMMQDMHTRGNGGAEASFPLSLRNPNRVQY
jgi:hypothetical protein